LLASNNKNTETEQRSSKTSRGCQGCRINHGTDPSCAHATLSKHLVCVHIIKRSLRVKTLVENEDNQRLMFAIDNHYFISDVLRNEVSHHYTPSFARVLQSTF